LQLALAAVLPQQCFLHLEIRRIEVLQLDPTGARQGQQASGNLSATVAQQFSSQQRCQTARL